MSNPASPRRAPKRENTGVTPEQLATLSHEFRTPLNGVLGMARLLDATRLTPEQRSYVEALKDCGDHLLNLVNDFLDLASLGAGTVPIHAAPLEVDGLLRQVCELMSPRAHEKGIDIAWASDPDLGRIVADEARLRQILLNLAGNAVKFTARGGVLLQAERRGEQVRLSVRDTGPGIPEAARERVFEAFAQTEFGAGHGGAGLGLAIVKRLAGAMNGQVGIEDAEGGGARVWIEGPFATERGGADLSLRGVTVTVASPSLIVREAAIRQIAACGGKAVAGENLADALLAAKRTRQDQRPRQTVLLADQALMTEARTPRPPVGLPAIVLLSPEQRGRIDKFRKAGWAGYLIKPLRRASLAEQVRAALGADRTAGAPDRDDDRVVSAAAKGVRVLLAEDNPINALLARTLLEREGCQVERVASGEAALAACGMAQFDLIITDLRMPGMGGLETARQLRQQKVTAPIVALTADAFDDDRRACMAAGMNDFLVKPLTPQALRAVLTRHTPITRQDHVADWTAKPQDAKLAS